MIFEAEPSQIVALNSESLVQLMRRLLLAECQLVEIPLRATVVPLQITVPDGGEDGRVEWSGGVERTNYLPARFGIFQSKAQNLTESLIRAEVLSGNGNGNGSARRAVNDAVADALARNGSYVVFCSRAFTGQKIGRLRNAIESAIREAGADPSQLAAIEVYDANRIADWVNTHPSVALWLTSKTRRRSVVGFQSLEAWGRDDDIFRVPWVSSDQPRFIPASRVLRDIDSTDRRPNGWTFDQAAGEIVGHLSDDQRILRIVGPSGFGKSRFAYELFNRSGTISDEVTANAVIRADLPIVADEVPKLALEIADAGWPTILVVDDCPDDVHATLASITQRAGSRLRLVTLDVESRTPADDDTLVISVDPASDNLIGQIARGVAPSLSDADARFIQELADGFPRMAVLAARRGGRRREALLSVEGVLNRIIWGQRIPSDAAQRSLEILSLFDWLGLSGRVKDQAEHVARELAGVPEDTFVEHVRSFRTRGIVVQRGDFVQVQPIPLAVRLALQRLALLPEGRLKAFFSQAPRELQMSLLHRFRWLDNSSVAQMFARQLLAEWRLGNFASLNTRFGSEVFDSLVHIDPDAVMMSLDRLLGGLTIPQLREISDGRRYIVWSLEKLAFRTNSFYPAATLLRRLGAAENEAHIGNSASGQFQQLYHLYLSGTEVGLEQRLRVLDDGLRSGTAEERALCVEALGQMLQTGHFSRIGGGDEIGSRQPMQDWAPKTYGDIWDFHRAAMGRLTDIATSNDLLAERARALLGSHIRSLLSAVPFADVKSMVLRVTADVGFWPEAIQGINSWLYFDRRNASPELAAEVRTFFDELLPTDPVELVALYTKGWSADFNNPDADFDPEHQTTFDHDYAAREASRLAETIIHDDAMVDRVLRRLVTSRANTVFGFARTLAEETADPVALFAQALRIAEVESEPANDQFFRGLIAGTEQRDPEESRKCIRAGLQSPKLKDRAVSIISSGRLRPDDIDLVVSLLRSKDVEPWQCATLSYGRGLDHLAIAEIMPLLDELGRQGSRGLWAALDIISMYLHGGRPLESLLAEKLKDTLLDPELLDDIARPNMDGHRLEQAVKSLLRAGHVDRRFASALLKRLLGICRTRQSEVFYALDDPVRSIIGLLLPLHPKEVWQEAARLLISKDWHVRFYGEHLFEPFHRNHLGAGLLHGLPASVYLGWVRKVPGTRAHIVVKWLPITETRDGTLAWSSQLEEYIGQFANQPRVLDELSRRLHPRSWSGSIVPHLEPLLPLLEAWAATSKRPEVTQWARQQLMYIADEIASERKKDEERDVGIF